MAKMKIGEMIDLAYTLREARLVRQREMEKEIEELKAEEKAVFDKIINTFTKQEIEAARGTFATAAIKTSISASVKDFPALWAWAKDNDAIDMFYKRVVSSAYQARIESGEAVPGVEQFVNKELSLTKISKR